MASKSNDSAAAAAADGQAADAQPGQFQAVFSDEDRRAGLILVRLGKKARVAGASIHGDAWTLFHEWDDRHPNDPGMGGELLVVQGQTVKAFPTAGVRRALGAELLEEVDPHSGDDDGGPVHDVPPNLADLAPAAAAAPVPNPPVVLAPLPAPAAAEGDANK